MKKSINREITPLQENDCFMIFDRQIKSFTYPVHFHPEFEINFIVNAGGGRRIVGDHIGTINKFELVMVGPDLFHGWENPNNYTHSPHQITIQFSSNLFDNKLLQKKIFRPIDILLKNAQRGILFSNETSELLKKQFFDLPKKRGFESYIAFQSLLYELAVSPNQSYLTNLSFQENKDIFNSDKIEKVYNYVRKNHNHKIMLNEVASLLNMSIVSFSRLIKQRTGKSFVDFVNEIRLGYATRMIIETNKSISEICYECGFNNISNFNRTFKKRQNFTPSQFRNFFKEFEYSN